MRNNFNFRPPTRSTKVKTAHGYPPETLRFSPNGKTLIACYGWDGVFFWNVTRLYEPPHIFKPTRHKYDPKNEFFLSVDVSPAGTYFIISSIENKLRLWHLGQDIPYVMFPLRSEITAAAYCHTAQRIAYQDIHNRINVYYAKTKKRIRRYKPDNNNTRNKLTFSANGRYLASHPCQIYDIRKGKTVDGFTNEGFKFQAFSNNSEHFWDAADKSQTLTLWNIQRGEQVSAIQKPTPQTGEKRYVESFAIAPCEQYVACFLYTYEQNTRIHLYDLLRWDVPIAVFEVPEIGVCPLAFSPDSTLLAGVAGKNVYLWDLKPYQK